MEVRTNTIAALTVYCLVKEPKVSKMVQAKLAPKPPIMLKSTLHLRKQEIARMCDTVTVGPGQRVKPKQCYICVGEAVTLLLLDPNLRELCCEFAALSSLVRHFRDLHLRFIDQSSLPPCPVCIPECRFQSIIYLQSHAHKVYGIY